ncbi:MAG: zinc ribbon domain-containing protein [Thermoguttaceae bacterium]|jgi:putative FmdB family regulatory protein
MPIYEYACRGCGHEFEYFVRGGETPSCPACGQTDLTKNFSLPAAHTGSKKDPACPAKDSCGAPRCGGGNCGMAKWM